MNCLLVVTIIAFSLQLARRYFSKRLADCGWHEKVCNTEIVRENYSGTDFVHECEHSRQKEINDAFESSRLSYFKEVAVMAMLHKSLPISDLG